MTTSHDELRPDVSGRTIAIGDIHGYSAALRSLIEAIDPRAEDTIVFLGDYLDRGPDTKGVIDLITSLEERCNVISLRGNHEEMFLGALESAAGHEAWLKCGGDEVLRSYSVDRAQEIPVKHIEFIRRCRKYHEDDRFIYVHANYWPNRPMHEQSAGALFWEELDRTKAYHHYSRKTVFVGHTVQPDGKPLDLGFVVGIDTGCGFGGFLTALNVETRQFWQVDQQGKLI